MFVTHLSLADFRSYPVADVPLDAGVTVFTGPNGQGPAASSGCLIGN